MPASSRALPAGCILGLSFFEPMMIPTWGSSTSISSKASSTAGIAVGVDAGVWPGVGSSEISLTVCPLWLSGHALDGAGGDVGADLHSLEGDPARGTVSALPRGRGGGPEAGDVEDPAAGGDDLAVALRGPGVGHLGERGCFLETVDRIALRGGGRVAGGSEHQGHGPVVGELGTGSREAARLAR